MKLTGYHAAIFQRNVLLVFVFCLVLTLGLSIKANSDVARAFAHQPAFLMLYDKRTGKMEIEQSVSSPDVTIGEEELFLRAKAAEYVVMRERYFHHLYEHDQRWVNSYSAASAAESYQTQVDPKNESSLVALLKRKGFAHVEITNAFPMPGSSTDYQVNWTLHVYGNPRDKPHKVKARSTMRIQQFQLNEVPRSKSERLLNPFGMKITDYQNSREIL